MPIIIYNFSKFKFEKSCLKQADLPNKDTHLRIIEDVSLADIKKVSKHNGTTFNVVVQAILSQTLAEYFRKRGDTKTK